MVESIVALMGVKFKKPFHGENSSQNFIPNENVPPKPMNKIP